MEIIEVEKLSKRFKNLVAVDDISFAVKKGEIFGFLGPNGAGKSTTIGMLATLIKPTGGSARIAGFDIAASRNDIRQSIGLVFQDPSLDDKLTAEENLRFHAKLYNVAKKDYQARMKEVLELVDLWDRKDDIVKIFSGGMKRRLEIARGFIHYPQVLFLDEPTIGLDPQTRAHLWSYVLKLKRDRGMTIFMTTHYMEEAEYCDRISIIDHGKIAALDTPANLKSMIGGDIITMESPNADGLKNELEKRYGLTAKTKDKIIQIEVKEGDKFLPKLFNELDAKISSIHLRKPTLDDVFLSLTGRAIREENASKKEIFKGQMGRRSY